LKGYCVTGIPNSIAVQLESRADSVRFTCISASMYICYNGTVRAVTPYAASIAVQ